MTIMARVWFGSVVLGFILFGCLVWRLFFSVPDFSYRAQAAVIIGDDTLTVWTAKNTKEWTQGLSGTDMNTLGADGMLFQFSDQQVRKFWMKDMRYDLDVLWIANGEILKISEGIQAPSSGEDEVARMDSEPFPVDWVLEVPAGTVSAKGWTVRDSVILTP